MSGIVKSMYAPKVDAKAVVASLIHASRASSYPNPNPYGTVCNTYSPCALWKKRTPPVYRAACSVLIVSTFLGHITRVQDGPSSLSVHRARQCARAQVFHDKSRAGHSRSMSLAGAHTSPLGRISNTVANFNFQQSCLQPKGHRSAKLSRAHWQGVSGLRRPHTYLNCAYKVGFSWNLERG